MWLSSQVFRTAVHLQFRNLSTSGECSTILAVKINSAVLRNLNCWGSCELQYTLTRSALEIDQVLIFLDSDLWQCSVTSIVFPSHILPFVDEFCSATCSWLLFNVFTLWRQSLALVFAIRRVLYACEIELPADVEIWDRCALVPDVHYVMAQTKEGFLPCDICPEGETSLITLSKD